MSNWWESDASGGGGALDRSLDPGVPSAFPRRPVEAADWAPSSNPAADRPTTVVDDASAMSGWESAPPPVVSSDARGPAKQGAARLAIIGVALLVGYVTVVVTQPLVTWRYSLLSEGSSVRLTDLEGGNARLWIFASPIDRRARLRGRSS